MGIPAGVGAFGAVQQAAPAVKHFQAEGGEVLALRVELVVDPVPIGTDGRGHVDAGSTVVDFQVEGLGIAATLNAGGDKVGAGFWQGQGWCCSDAVQQEAVGQGCQYIEAEGQVLNADHCIGWEDERSFSGQQAVYEHYLEVVSGCADAI